MNVYQIKPPTYLLIAILLVIALNFLLPIMILIPSPWTLIGLLPLVAGLAIDLRADRAFHLVGTAVCPFEAASALVTDGPYRWTRNPMYLGFVLVLIGVSVLLGSLTPFVIVAAFAVLLDLRFVRMEEQELAATFGIQWDLYKQRTRRWL